MNKDLKFLLKRAFDAGTMYEATLSEECSFNEFIKYVEKQQLSIYTVIHCMSDLKNNKMETENNNKELKLRDEFAMEAMKQLIRFANNNNNDADSIALEAYTIANKMIKYRNTLD